MPAPKLAADFRPRIEKLLAAFGRLAANDATRLVVEQGAAFAERVAAWNERIDLTSARDPDELVDLLFADAAAILEGHPCSPGERWLDVGSGMGAPGVALALLEPGLKMTLVEPRAKRVAFLRTLLHALERPDVHVERVRSDALSDASCDVAVSRATLPPEEWLREGARLAGRDVWVLLARGATPDLPGWAVARALDFRWPLTQKERRAVCFRRNPGSVSS
ncbi:MAG TPA: RsmG family class I SAM-dependent methyltransferase [Polyangiaceae bacterium]